MIVVSSRKRIELHVITQKTSDVDVMVEFIQ
jgi:hypothetical protein